MTSRLEHIVSMFFIRTLVKLLPDRMKRLLVIVSLYNHLLERESLTEQERQVKLTELNDALHLATTSSRSLALGLLFSEPLWGGRTNITMNNLKREQVDSFLPHFLRYGRDVDIEADVRNLDKFLLTKRNA